jgi:hypothetical protein
MIGVLTAYLKTTRVQTAAALYFLISGSLTQLPLFNYLGYEFSAVMTIPAALISGTLAILWLRDHRASPLTRRTWLSVFGDYLLVNALLLLIPLIVITLNAVAVKNCAYAKGMLYYLLLPGVTMLFSVPLALVIGTLFRKAVTIFILTVGALLGHILLITYLQPQLFAYNFILGFFPGITYDESLTDMSALVLYRQFTIIAAVMLAALFFILLRSIEPERRTAEQIRMLRRSWKSDRMLWSVVLFCVLLLGAAHLFRNSMGFEYSAADIREALGRRSESAHFIIYYDADNFTAEEMRRTKAEAEFHYRKLSDALKLKEYHRQKIGIYIYPDGEHKQRFIGTSNTNIAKPWKREMHITVATFRTSFRHELVHVLAAEFGTPVIRASVKMGLNEGLAVALDWDEGMFTPHQYAAGILRMNGLEHADRLFTMTGFASQPSSYAYLVSGSFIRYLIDRYGIERVRHVFPNGNFMGIFGESLENLVGDWKAFLKTVDDSELPPETVRALFAQQSIFLKTCAREVADQNKLGVVELREKRYAEAAAIFRKAYDNAPSAFALRGIFQSLNAQQKPSEVITLFAQEAKRSSGQIQPGVLMLLGDAYYLDRRYRQAAAVYDSVRRMMYSDAFTEAAALRMQCISDSIDQEDFYTLYYGGLTDSAKTRFVRGKIQLRGESAAFAYHNTLLGSGSGADQQRFAIPATAVPELQYYALLRAARQYKEHNRFEDAKVLYWQAKNLAPTPAAADQLDEQIDLCDFTATEFL